GRALPVVGREGERGGRGGLGQLRDVTEALALVAQLVLGLRLEAGRVLRQRAQLGDALGGRGGVARQLVVAAPCGLERAPRASRLAAPTLLLVADERVEHVELVRRPREAALLELARHRDQPLRRSSDVLACRAPAPGVGAGAAVGED